MSDRATLKRALLLASAVAGVLSMSSAAYAESEADAAVHKAGNALEEVIVLAQRTTIEIARAAQQEAPNLINLTTADEMAKLPDVNTGEAVRRIPGISLETDTGEGRYINIRGLDADLNSTTFGGLRLPPTNNSSPSGAGRAVAFDSIPVGFVGAITVTKSNLPEQDAEAIGGTIDITPKTAPADGRPFLELKLGGGTELQRHTGITDLAMTAGTRFGGPTGGYQPFSVLVTASIYNDGRGIDDAEAGFVDQQPAVPDKAIGGFDQRYYQYHRQRHGYGIDLGYAPDEANKYFVRYYDAGYTETVHRNMLQWNFDGPSTVSPTNPNVLLDVFTAGDFAKRLRDEKETLDSKVFEIGGKNALTSATVDYHVGYTKGTYDKPYDYNSKFTSSASGTASYDNSTNPNWPTLNVLTPAGFSPADPSSYTLGKMQNSNQHSDDHEWGIGANVSIPTRLTSRADEQFKFGINARIRDKVGDSQSWSMSAPTALALSSVTTGGNVSFYKGLYQNGPNINPAAMQAYWAANNGADAANSDPVSTALNNIHDKEDVYAAYGQYQFGYGPVGVVAGVRVEQTKATYSGFKADTSGSPESASCPKLGTDSTPVCAVSADKTYNDFFPSAQLRYEFSADLIGRLAISSAIARPGFGQVTATTVVDAGGNIITGNPDLKPTKAISFDAAIEHYLPHAGIVSVGVFAKDIKDYIVTNAQQTTTQKTAGNLGLALLTSFTNGAAAHVYGVEANYVERFRSLPGALGGLGVSANWTWVQSKYTVPVVDPATNLTTLSRDSVLPSTSRNTANAELLYEMHGLNLSIGAYYTNRNIFGMGSSASTDIWAQDRFSVDFGSQYKVNDTLQVYLNAKNLTNTALKLTEGEGENRVIQREFYGVTLQAGVNVKF